jgi:hypothetical protein
MWFSFPFSKMLQHLINRNRKKRGQLHTQNATPRNLSISTLQKMSSPTAGPLHDALHLKTMAKRGVDAPKHKIIMPVEKQMSQVSSYQCGSGFSQRSRPLVEVNDDGTVDVSMNNESFSCGTSHNMARETARLTPSFLRRRCARGSDTAPQKAAKRESALKRSTTLGKTSSKHEQQYESYGGLLAYHTASLGFH